MPQAGENTGKTDPQRVIDAVMALAPMYGGINLEDIAAPACFEIEDRLDAMLDIPVFHDDQWGTAVITVAGLLNYAHSERPLDGVPERGDQRCRCRGHPHRRHVQGRGREAPDDV